MSKSITQDMAYRQSLMKVAEKMALLEPAGNITKAGRISTSVKRAGAGAEGRMTAITNGTATWTN